MRQKTRGWGEARWKLIGPVITYHFHRPKPSRRPLPAVSIRAVNSKSMVIFERIPRRYVRSDKGRQEEGG